MNAAPWFIRPVCLKYNIRSLQWSSPNVKSKQSSGDERTEENPKQQNTGTDGEPWQKTGCFHVSWENTEAGNHMEWSYPGRTPTPRLSNASLERMINMSLLLALFPPFQIKHVFTAAQTRPLAKSKSNADQKKIENKTTLAFSYICISAFIQPGCLDDMYSFLELCTDICVELSGTIEPVCTVWHMRKHWGQFQVTCDSCFFFLEHVQIAFSTDSIMRSKVND